MKSLERWGTIAFDPKYMMETIRFGWEYSPKDREAMKTAGVIPPPEHALDLSVWLLMVPDVYKEAVTRGAENVAAGFVGEKATKNTKAAVVDRLYEWIYLNVERH